MIEDVSVMGGGRMSRVVREAGDEDALAHMPGVGCWVSPSSSPGWIHRPPGRLRRVEGCDDAPQGV